MEAKNDLYGALARHDMEAAIAILQRNAALRYSYIVVGKTPLHLAAQKTNVPYFGFCSIPALTLIKSPRTAPVRLIASRQDKDISTLRGRCLNGADVNLGFGVKATPIFSAIYGQSLTVVKALIEYGANLDAAFGNDVDVITYARMHGTREIVDYLANDCVGRPGE